MPKLPLMRCQFLIADLLLDIDSPTGSLPEKHPLLSSLEGKGLLFVPILPAILSNPAHAARWQRK